MKKIILILFFLIGIMIISNNDDGEVIIPKEAIRFRVIANSNKEKDQKNKKIIANNLRKDITTLLKDTNDISSTRLTLNNNIDKFKTNIDETIKKNNIKTTYKINYGQNYFPEKRYKGVKYEAGEYESLVVTLGNGKGENFWCVLFPPLCLLEGKETNNNEIEYKSYIKELIDKYF